jgi:hypothetical protein
MSLSGPPLSGPVPFPAPGGVKENGPSLAASAAEVDTQCTQHLEWVDSQHT